MARGKASKIYHSPLVISIWEYQSGSRFTRYFGATAAGSLSDTASPFYITY
jgi:hypothetical protein